MFPEGAERAAEG